MVKDSKGWLIMLVNRKLGLALSLCLVCVEKFGENMWKNVEGRSFRMFSKS
jgi:hypothetical protein